MNHNLHTKIVEVLKKYGYNDNFINAVMKKNEYLPKTFGFRKDALDLILNKYKKKYQILLKILTLKKNGKTNQYKFINY